MPVFAEYVKRVRKSENSVIAKSTFFGFRFAREKHSAAAFSRREAH